MGSAVGVGVTVGAGLGEADTVGAFVDCKSVALLTDGIGISLSLMVGEVRFKQSE